MSIVSSCSMQKHPVVCRVSARHYHPGPDFAMEVTKKLDLSQGGHWATNEKVESNGMRFTVVMPPRPKAFYEMSVTDWRQHLEGDPVFDEGEYQVKQRHFHCDAKTASEWGLVDRQKVSIYKGGRRAGRLDEVVVRIDPWSVPEVHLDTDEANALLIKDGDQVELIIE